MSVINCIALLLSIASLRCDTIDFGCNKMQIEATQSVDSMLLEIDGDSIFFSYPTTISKIIVSEQKKNANAFYTIIFPIITLILGVALDRSAQSFYEKRKMKRNGRRWKSELQSCVKPMQNQIRTLSDFVHQYCENPQSYEIPNIMIFPTLKGTAFASLNKADLQDYLECKKDSRQDAQERFYKTTSFVMSMEMVYQMLIEAYNRFKESSGNIVESFNTNQLNYSKLLLATSSAVPETLDKDAYDRLRELYDQAFMAHPNINIYEIEDSFINASLTVLVDYDKKEFQNLNNLLIDMRACVNGLRLEKEYLKENFNTVIEQYENCIGALNEINDYFPN